jgi:hypothetical protein
LTFESISTEDIPRCRASKHRAIVERLLHDIAALKKGYALKVPLDDLPDTAKNVRSALNRATQLKGISIHTSSDSNFFYVWQREDCASTARSA